MLTPVSAHDSGMRDKLISKSYLPFLARLFEDEHGMGAGQVEGRVQSPLDIHPRHPERNPSRDQA